MSDKQLDSLVNYLVDNPMGKQAGYLPVPLRDIPFTILKKLNLYLLNNGNFTLYRDKELEITQEDVEQLIRSKVQFAYVPVKDHLKYYSTLESCLTNIVSDPELPTERKAEILYSTSIALIDQVYNKPPKDKAIKRVQNVSKALVQLILQNKNAFKHLFEISNHDYYNATHVVNVCISMIALGIKLEFDRETLEDIGTGALLHDIGKIFIPSEILNKDDKLTKEEMKILQKHVTLGVEFLEEKELVSSTSIQIVKEHHERLDGSGYPNELASKEISVFGRMIGIVDTYEAMTSVRPYRIKSYSIHDVMKMLSLEAPKKYDEAILGQFQKMMKEQLNIERNWNAEALMEYCKSADIPTERMPRFTFRMPMQTRPIYHIDQKYKLGKVENIIAHNISRSGICFLSPRKIDVGQNIYITIKQLDDKQLEPLIGMVVRAKNHGDGWYSLGAKFHKTQDPDLIKHIRTVTLITEEFSVSG